jgi:hypothetical protein
VQPINPVNLTSLFRAGLNDVTLTLSDACGGGVGASPVYLVW